MSVCITGLGVVSAAGMNVADTVSFMKKGIRPSQVNKPFKTEFDYPVFSVNSLFLNENDTINRTNKLLELALNEALIDSGLSSEALRSNRIGVVIGTTISCQLNDIDFYSKLKSSDTLDDKSVLKYFSNNPSEFVKNKLDAKGPFLTVTNACSSGTDALGIGFEWIEAGICDIVIAGGADELNLVPYAGFRSLSVISSDYCKPFDKFRNGLNLGEGAGVLILENEYSARQRGLNKPLKMYGYSSFADAFHLTAPQPEGSELARCIKDLLLKASIKERDISFINAHGTATKDNDKVEGRVFKNIFGERISFYSSKGVTGHTLGAAGAIEAVFCCINLIDGWIPPSVGFSDFDEDIGIAPVSRVTQIEKKYAISTSLAFGGNNSALLIGF